MKTWSTPYFGVTHLHEEAKRSFATVTAHDGFAVATFNAHPVRFGSPEQRFQSVEAAKAAAESWIDTQRI